MMPDQPNSVAIAVGGACWLLSLLAYLLGYRRSARRFDAMADVPTIAAKDVPGLGAGMVEVKGLAVAANPLVSDLARVPCVIFQCSVTEHWTTTRTERDSDGKTRRVTEHHSEVRYANHGEIDFQVRDGSGDVTVHPNGAERDLLDSMADLTGPLPGSPAYGILPRRWGGHLSYGESVMPVGQQVYVLGQVSDDNMIAKPEVVDRPFIISHRTEEFLRRRAEWGKRIWGGVAALVFVGGAIALAAGLGIIDDLAR